MVARRGRAPSEVVAELDDAVSRRTAALQAHAFTDPDAVPDVTPGGIGWSWAVLMRNRPLDVWVHEQDIRRAIGQPGGLDSAVARHTQSVFTAALPYVIGKRAAAPAGTMVLVDVTGPVPAVYAVEVNESGRGVALDPAPDKLPIRVEVGAGAGPQDADNGQDLAHRILAGMAVTP